MSIMVWERNAHFCSPTPIPEQAKKLKNWWKNKGKKWRNDISSQMLSLGAQSKHSNFLSDQAYDYTIRETRAWSICLSSSDMNLFISHRDIPPAIQTFTASISQHFMTKHCKKIEEKDTLLFTILFNKKDKYHSALFLSFLCQDMIWDHFLC